MCYPGANLEPLAKRRGCPVLRAPQAVEATGGGGGGGRGGRGGMLKQCVCSPTSHPGSFRCRHHQAEYVWRGRVIQAAANNNIYIFKVTQREG